LKWTFYQKSLLQDNLCLWNYFLISIIIVYIHICLLLLQQGCKMCNFNKCKSNKFDDHVWYLQYIWSPRWVIIDVENISSKQFGNLFFQLGIVFGGRINSWTIISQVGCWEGVTSPLSIYPIHIFLTLNSMAMNAINPRRQVFKFPFV
jgi:hypothetical protein